MGAMLSNAFIPPGTIMGCESIDDVVECAAPFSSGEWGWGMMQVLSLMSVYGYVLFSASNMLSDGSEMLLLVPELAGIVGSVVLPILGAVPGAHTHGHIVASPAAARARVPRRRGQLPPQLSIAKHACAPDR